MATFYDDHPPDWIELSRTRVEADDLGVDVVLSRAPDYDGSPRIVLTLEGRGANLEGEMPGEYWLSPVTAEDLARWALGRLRVPQTPENVDDLVSLLEHDVPTTDLEQVLEVARDHWPPEADGDA